jgi:hypothetical protein
MNYRLLYPTLLFFVTIQGAFGQSTGKNYEFKNGNWYNGTDFTAMTWYVSNGVLSKKPPVKIDSVIDLENRWVVPPMADAYCGSLSENPSAEQQMSAYLNDGIFYVQVLTNTKAGREKVQNLQAKYPAMSLLFGNGAMTCTRGVPFIQYEAPAMGLKNSQLWGKQYDQIKGSSLMRGDGYWFLDDKNAVQANWERIAAQKPGVITIYLLDAANKGGKENGGLSLEVAKAVIKKAHKADLRVFARVETAEDLRQAVKLGVDGIANLPGNNWDGTGDTNRFELSADDIKKLAKKKIPVIALLSQAQYFGLKPNVQAWHLKTLNRLFEQKVLVAIGSDDPIRTARAELTYWFNLGPIDSKEVLRSLCETTARTIFPDRKIGKFADGYEASFLILNANPIDNILKIRVISDKVHKGQYLPRPEMPKKG